MAHDPGRYAERRQPTKQQNNQANDSESQNQSAAMRGVTSPPPPRAKVVVIIVQIVVEVLKPAARGPVRITVIPCRGIRRIAFLANRLLAGSTGSARFGGRRLRSGLRYKLRCTLGAFHILPNKFIRHSQWLLARWAGHLRWHDNSLVLWRPIKPKDGSPWAYPLIFSVYRLRQSIRSLAGILARISHLSIIWANNADSDRI